MEAHCGQQEPKKPRKKPHHIMSIHTVNSQIYINYKQHCYQSGEGSHKPSFRVIQKRCMMCVPARWQHASYWLLFSPPCPYISWFFCVCVRKMWKCCDSIYKPTQTHHYKHFDLIVLPSVCRTQPNLRSERDSRRSVHCMFNIWPPIPLE